MLRGARQSHAGAATAPASRDGDRRWAAPANVDVDDEPVDVEEG